MIACGVLAVDSKRIAKELGVDLSFTFLEGGLHSKPKLLKQKLQEAIDDVSTQNKYDRIVIGYGLCGNGTVGITARNVPLVIPKVHDCIALFLGSDQAYKREFAKYPGTYYISAGWYQEKVQPQGQKQQGGSFIAGKTVTDGELVNDYGQDNADVIRNFVNSWQKNYQRAVFINTSAPGMAKFKAYAENMAKAYGWKYEQVEGDCELLRKSFEVTATTDEILVVPPNHITFYDAKLRNLNSGPQNQENVHIAESKEIILNGGGDKQSHEYSRLGLGIDAGGTYTDASIYDFDSEKIVAKGKALTTKWNYSIGIREVLEQLPAGMLGRVDLVSVSTTLATNAIVEGHGSRVGLLLMPSRGIFNPDEISHDTKAVLRGKLDISGTVVEPVDHDQVRDVAKEMHRNGVDAFAISGYAGVINPELELTVKKIVKETIGCSVTCGHELSDMLDFKTRAMTAVLNARIIGRIEKFIQQLKATLDDFKIHVPVMVVKGDGTLMSEQMAAVKPIETVLSGPAASVAGARYLTELKDAIVVDMGGTTTDTAIVKDGVIRVHDSGTRVGSHKTHVKALDMRTVGLGGDSIINFMEGNLKIGPRRVGPVCWMASKNDGVESALKYLEDRRDDYKSSTELMQFFVLSDPDYSLDLNEHEQAIVDALAQRPYSFDELTNKLELSWHTMLRIERLEEHHVITRCGLTPTDILHASGEFKHWDSSISRRICDLFASICGVETETLIERVREEIIRKLTVEILKKQLDEKTDSDELDKCCVCNTLLENMFKSDGDDYSVSIKLNSPVIGVGAPAGYFVPQAAEKLSTKAIIPEDGDVANAIGAISSDVLIRRSVRISIYDEVFVVEGLPGSQRFSKLEDAHDYAVAEIVKLVRKLGHDSGTSNTKVKVSYNDIIGPAAEGFEVYLGREIRAELSGRPDVKINC